MRGKVIIDIPNLIWRQRDRTISAPVTWATPRESYTLSRSIIGIASRRNVGGGKLNGGGELLTVNVRLAMKLCASREAGQVSAVCVGWSELASRPLRGISIRHHKHAISALLRKLFMLCPLLSLCWGAIISLWR